MCEVKCGKGFLVCWLGKGSLYEEAQTFMLCLPMQGDLGAIDEKYDIAISTACGPLDNIVVDTMETAMKCVEFLRKNDVGVATFIGLDKVGAVYCAVWGLVILSMFIFSCRLST